jgi:cytochrome c biogenesis protein CcdA
MRIKSISTSMGIAITILIAGITVQITDNLDIFGRNSYIPLIIGLSIIAVGVVFFLILRLITKNRSARKNASDN